MVYFSGEGGIEGGGYSNNLGGGGKKGGTIIEYYSTSFWQLQSIFFIFSTYVHFFGPTTPKGNL